MARFGSIFIPVFMLALSGLILSRSNAVSATPELVRFAAIGDFDATANTRAVADLIHSWNPDFVVTMGDNNYSGDASTSAWDNAVGQFFGAYIHYPVGSTSVYSPGAASNRFFPALGNHDWDAQGYTDYFELPGNERYYAFAQGPVQFFVIDSDPREPAGLSSNSTQALWLKSQLALSEAPWKIVVFHHPPYSSAAHGNTPWMQWPYQQWGASIVLTGHDHDYERIMHGSLPYVVNGFGGRDLYAFNIPQPGSVVRYNASYGTLLIEATPLTITFKAYSIVDGGTLIDAFTLDGHPSIGSELLVGSGSDWNYLDDGSEQGMAWIDLAFDDQAWPIGLAKLGYGGDGEITSIGYGGDPANKYLTTYFRRTFTVIHPARYARLSLDVLRDDGAVVYLNGAEVWRTNLPNGAIVSTTLAASTVSGSDENAFFTTAITPALLISGTNVVAVEVHQISGSSSDLGFDLALWGEPPRVYLPLMQR